MIDFNAIISNTIISILDEYTKPLVERITVLEGQTDEYVARIAVLEERMNAATPVAPVPDTQPTQEGTALPDAERIEAMVNKAVHDAIEAHLEHTAHMCADDVEEIIDDKISDHCNDYDHDDFLTEIDEYTVRDMVSNCLRGATIRLG